MTIVIALIVLRFTRSIHLIIFEEALKNLPRHLKDIIYSNLSSISEFWLWFCYSNFGKASLRSTRYFKLSMFADFIICSLES